MLCAGECRGGEGGLAWNCGSFLAFTHFLRLFLLFICRRCVVAASLPAASLVRVFSRPHLQWRLQLKADVSLPLPLPHPLSLSLRSLIAVVLVRARSAFSSCRRRRRLALFLYYQRERTAAALLLLRNCFKLCLSQPLPVPPPPFYPLRQALHARHCVCFLYPLPTGFKGYNDFVPTEEGLADSFKYIYSCSESICLPVSPLVCQSSVYLQSVFPFVFFISLVCLYHFCLSVFPSVFFVSSAFLLSVFCPSFPLLFDCLSVFLSVWTSISQRLKELQLP